MPLQRAIHSRAHFSRDSGRRLYYFQRILKRRSQRILLIWRQLRDNTLDCFKAIGQHSGLLLRDPWANLGSMK